MNSHRFRAATCLLLAGSVPVACQRQKSEPSGETIGHHITHLTVHVFGGWGGGYTVDVAPEQYILVEHKNCPDGKEPRVPTDAARGLCVLRISKEQSDRFQAAMERFKRNAIPLESFSLDDPFVRPDGKPCRNNATDATGVTLQWTGTEGAKIATFYTGCDEEEFDGFYKSVFAVTDPLPIQQIIAER